MPCRASLVVDVSIVFLLLLLLLLLSAAFGSQLPEPALVLVFDHHLVVVEGRQVQVFLPPDLVVVVEFRGGDRDPAPLGVGFVLDGEAAIPVHGGVPDHDPVLRYLVGKGRVCLSSPGTDCDVDGSRVGEVPKSNVFRPLVGVDVSRQHDVDCKLDHERLEVFFRRKDLWIVVVEGKRVVDRRMHREEHPGSDRSIDRGELGLQPLVLGRPGGHVRVRIDHDVAGRSVGKGVIRVSPFVGQRIGRGVHVHPSFFAVTVVDTEFRGFQAGHAEAVFVAQEDLFSRVLLVNV